MTSRWGIVYRSTGEWSPDQSTVDYAAGFGDTMSLGITRKTREWMGIDGGVDICSNAYLFGERTGFGFTLVLGAAHFGRHAANLGWKQFRTDPRQYKAVQRQWSTSVGGYTGKYQLHHWWKPQSAGGTSAGWNLVPVSGKFNNMMGNGGFLYNAFKYSLIATYVGAAGTVPTAAVTSMKKDEVCPCE